MYVVAQGQLQLCFVSFTLQLVGLVYLVSTISYLNQKGASLLGSLDMLLMTNTPFLSGFLHVLTLAS